MAESCRVSGVVLRQVGFAKVQRPGWNTLFLGKGRGARTEGVILKRASKDCHCCSLLGQMKRMDVE